MKPHPVLGARKIEAGEVHNSTLALPRMLRIPARLAFRGKCRTVLRRPGDADFPFLEIAAAVAAPPNIASNAAVISHVSSVHEVYLGEQERGRPEGPESHVGRVHDDCDLPTLRGSHQPDGDQGLMKAQEPNENTQGCPSAF